MSHEPVRRSVAVERLLERWGSPGGTRADGTRADGTRADGTPTERVALDRLAGRVLAAAATAPADVPAHDRATMDGYAFAAGDDAALRIVGEVYAEDDPPSVARGEAVRVATGAPLPSTADAVVRREDARVADGRLSRPDLDPGTNVYPAGATATAGEELLAAGERLAPRHAALLRDVGVDAVTVRRPLDVGLLPTGSEIAAGRQPDRDSEALANLVRGWGHEPTILDAVPDDAAAVRGAVADAAARRDLLVTTGGTGGGSADHVVRVLADHDAFVRGVALRPGRPATAATVDGTPVCALPGKPVAAHTAATLLLRPFLAGTGRLPTVPATATARTTVPDGDVEFAVPVRLDGDRATPLGHADSPLHLYDERFAPGRVASSTRVLLADGLVLTRDGFDAGEPVRVVPYEVVE
jgi:molybdopterin molybdotransferase